MKMETTRMVARRSHIRLSGVMVHRGDEFDATEREVEEYARHSHLAEPVDAEPAQPATDGDAEKKPAAKAKAKK